MSDLFTNTTTTEQPKGLRVEFIRIENLGPIEAAEIDFSIGPIIIAQGGNGSGKSTASLLFKAVRSAIDPTLLRDGSDEGPCKEICWGLLFFCLTNENKAVYLYILKTLKDMNATEIYLDNNSFDAQIEFTHAVRSILEKSGGRTLYNVGYVKFDSVIVRLSDHAPSYIRIENDIDNDLCTRFIDARIGFASSNRDTESEREDFLASYPNCLTELEAEKHYESAQAFALRILECIA